MRRSTPDLYRLILEDFAAEKEKEFHIGQHLDTSALMAAEQSLPYGTSDTERIKRKPAKPVVIYTSKKKPS